MPPCPVPNQTTIPIHCLFVNVIYTFNCIPPHTMGTLHTPPRIHLCSQLLEVYNATYISGPHAQLPFPRYERYVHLPVWKIRQYTSGRLQPLRRTHWHPKSLDATLPLNRAGALTTLHLVATQRASFSAPRFQRVRLHLPLSHRSSPRRLAASPPPSPCLIAPCCAMSNHTGTAPRCDTNVLLSRLATSPRAAAVAVPHHASLRPVKPHCNSRCNATCFFTPLRALHTSRHASKTSE